MDKKTCSKCRIERDLIEFPGRRRVCTSCATAARQRTQERKEAVTWTPELGERITDAIASGISVAEVCAMAGMPTARQLSKWRRTIPEFAEAYEQARIARADVRSDRVDEALRDLRAGKISAADCRVIVEAELKLAGKENPGRYGDATQIDLTSAGKPLQQVDIVTALKALLDALPSLPPAALPAPEPLEVEATPVVTETLQ